MEGYWGRKGRGRYGKGREGEREWGGGKEWEWTRPSSGGNRRPCTIRSVPLPVRRRDRPMPISQAQAELWLPLVMPIFGEKFHQARRKWQLGRRTASDEMTFCRPRWENYWKGAVGSRTSYIHSNNCILSDTDRRRLESRMFVCFCLLCFPPQISWPLFADWSKVSKYVCSLCFSFA